MLPGSNYYRIDEFDEDNLIWIVRCSECDVLFANVRLSVAVARFDVAHHRPTFVNPMKRHIDLTD
jgi:hypothetical protein